jgi:hypothetical protein
MVSVSNMDSKEKVVEDVLKDFLIYSKYPKAFKDVLLKLDSALFSQLTNINNKMKTNFKIEKKIKKNDKKIMSALYELKYMDDEYKLNFDFKTISELLKRIQEKTLSIKDLDLNKIHQTLTKAEETDLNYLPLYASFGKARLYNYLVKKEKIRKVDIYNKFKIQERQLYYYLSFFELIKEFNFLLKVKLSFSTLVKRKKDIINIINNDEELKNTCQKKISYDSLSNALTEMNIEDDSI